MNREKVINDYFEWLVAIVSKNRFDRNVSYRKLLMYLHTVKFKWIIEDDLNRANDGISLRWRFVQDIGKERYYEAINECLSGQCSVLEMLIALAVRCEETIMDDPNYGNRTAQWFWKMINNLGFSGMYNDNFDKKIVSVVIEKFLNREYAPDGRGGLFIIRNYQEDLRTVPIWKQLCWYLDIFS